MSNRTETENNNLRPNANSIYAGDVMTGKISTQNDVDCFKINFDYAGTVKFELDVPSNTNYRMRVFINDESNSVTEDVSTTMGTMRAATASVNINDTYYVVVSPQTTGIYNANSNYTLRIYYVDNKLVTTILNGYKSTYEGKYWNKGLSSGLSAGNWGTTSAACGATCTSNMFGSAYQCAGFTLFMASVVFGTAFTHSTLTSYSNNTSITSTAGNWKIYKGTISNITLKPGDFLRKNGHSAMVWKVEGTDVYVIECWGSVGCKLAYGWFNGSSANRSMSTLLSGTIEYLLVSPVKKVI